jgi:trehalose utilization protein
LSVEDRRQSVLVWNEFVHEQEPGKAHDTYPTGIHEVIAGALTTLLPEWHVTTAVLSDPNQGISSESLSSVDVLIWWSHIAHDDILDETVEAVIDHVQRGMGLVVLHSSAESKIFKALMGTTCSFRWREGDDQQLIWNTDPSHPIARGVPPVIRLERHEMYGEFFDIPRPDSVIFTSSYSGGEVFRSGCTFTRGNGHIFYFSPGHETYPVYYDASIQRILANAVEWAASGSDRVEVRRFIESKTGWYDSAKEVRS